MKSYSSSSVTASLLMVVSFSYTTRFAIAQNHTQYVDNRDCIGNSLSPSSSIYTQLPHGQTTYDLDDGGCYFCSKFEGSTFPLSDYDILSDNCQQMCNSDPLCTAYTIGRPAILHAHEYYWGHAANCCLERGKYPADTFVHPPQSKDEYDAPTNCQLDTLCWTRFENKCSTNANNNEEGEVQPSRTFKQTIRVPPPRPSNLCKKVWKSRKYTPEKISQQIEFIAGGCQHNDTTYLSMQKEAYKECKAEILNPESIMNQSHSHRHIWIAHGLIGVFTFGILVPISLFFKDVLVPHHWMILQGYINLLVIITVSIAIGTMHSMGSAGETHTKERHHIVGLLLLLLVSLQTAVNAFLRRPRRVVDTMADNEEDEGEVLFVKTNGTYWKYINVFFGLLIFGLGASQIHAGIQLFTMRYGTGNWGKYIYNVWFVLLIACVWVRIRGRIVKYADPSSMSAASTEVQLPPYDPVDQQDERSLNSSNNGHIWTNVT